MIIALSIGGSTPSDDRDPDWLQAVRDNRDALERIAKHGQTDLADDVRKLLNEADREVGDG